MSCEIQCCVFTRGEFYIRDAPSICAGPSLVCDAVSGFRKMGNVSSGLIEIEGTVVGRENKFNPAMPESRLEVLGVNLSLSVTCASKENLIRALAGSNQVTDSGHHVEDFCFDSLDDCMFYPFSHKGASNIVVSLRKDMEEVKILSEASDYLVSSSGIKIINNNIDTGTGNVIRLSYDYNDEDFYSVELMSKAPNYKELYFKGLNYGDDSLKLFDAQFYRVLFSPINQLDLITSNDFLTLNLVGTVENTSGKWFEIKRQE